MNNALENNWGNINLYQATANSVNTVFMNVNEHLTPKRTAAIAHEAGIQAISMKTPCTTCWASTP